MGRITQHLQVPRVVSTETKVFVNTRPDTIAVEEPLEIRVNGTNLTTTMRTPGHDIELVHGLLLAEGLIRDASEVSTARYCAGAVGPDNQNTYNVLELDVVPANPRRELNLVSVQRNLPTSSACGVCGTTSIEQLMDKKGWPIEPITPDPRMIITLPEKLRERQKMFDKTGGVHAAGLATLDGELLVVREDVGRHNAADKVIGHMLMNGRLPLRDTILVMSSRASFELVQKAAMAGIPGVIAVGAATSLAVDTARDAGMFLAGFVRGNKFNHYAGELG
ncbi:formate dehydrogenase family accessory protein FdhD [Corynebacterium efficiens YS-314]|uniref:Sulfur carrier protein FdhD n=1 Tax=Corynebacterium efficiens (strain DSM 44549 / YS-314 / AJ 12310 / JCM 11189 / NBRC 100395) TaxID=196164 RepID=FDHD_COREF|nr:formate dehydrogenase accessory sulfurtransferase FdhD [Corynebacterium efficiens]Q8FS66.1 RecName: Full=Sulfur carrier protein FdhD [Corynebacterium efficiens YS-314]EEW50202.1 formate dehydrogenase family accessory protein FdhD [Corynebacterium efficiens YS-314]BAC17348.1 putative formate dehydrogenase FdhD [Corynebacterium efficiens YS-314]